MRMMIALAVGTVASLSLILIGPGCDAANKAAEAAKEAAAALTNITNELNKGVALTQSDQGEWAKIVQDTTDKALKQADKLPQDVQSTLRTEVQQLADRSVAKGGVQFHAGVDFLARRAGQGLQRIVSILKKEPVAPLEPGFDTVSPPQVLLSDDPARRTSVQLYGYDMDHVDSKGQAFTVVMMCENGQILPMPEIKIGRNTHYQCTIDISGDELEKIFTKNRVGKLQVSWNGQTKGLPEVLITQRPLPTATTEVKTGVRVTNTGSLTLVPRRIHGDADFGSNDGNPMDLRVIVQTRKDATHVQARLYMWAFETRGDDHTTAEQWTEWSNIYTADPGWRIRAVSPLGQTDHHQLLTRSAEDAQGRIVVDRPAGEVAFRFEIYGDQIGDEAGTRTKVIATLSPITVDLERTVIH